jgi:hypothetical protein
LRHNRITAGLGGDVVPGRQHQATSVHAGLAARREKFVPQLFDLSRNPNLLGYARIIATPVTAKLVPLL